MNHKGKLLALLFALASASLGCGGSESDDGGEDDAGAGDGGIVIAIDGGEGCTPFDSSCDLVGRNGIRCVDGHFEEFRCDSGSTCLRAVNGTLSCKPDSGCPQGRHDDGTGNCVAQGCADTYKDNGLGECIFEFYPCAEGYHDGGLTDCLPLDKCASGYHGGGDGTCVPLGECADGYHDGTGGGAASETPARTCVQADSYCNAEDNGGMRCKNGKFTAWTCEWGHTCSREDNGWLSCIDEFHTSSCSKAKQYCEASGTGGMACVGGEWEHMDCPNGSACGRAADGTLSCVPLSTKADDGICVPLGTCSDGYHDGGKGDCMALGKCAQDYHDGGDGDCVPKGTCSPKYHDNAAGKCVKSGCISGYEYHQQTNSCVVAYKWTNIPGGNYTLPHDATDSADEDAQTIEEDTTVNVPAFSMGTYLVTMSQFKICVAAKACSKEHFSDEDSLNDSSVGQTPVGSVDAVGAEEFCRFVGGRLPTEIEWEYAATHNGTKATGTTYPWGNDEPKHCVHASYRARSSNSNNIKYCNGSQETSSPGDAYQTKVGSYQAGKSPLGLYDMAGLSSEWTGSVNPLQKEYRILKGGSHTSEASDLKVIERDYSYPSKKFGNYGFRCAKDR